MNIHSIGELEAISEETDERIRKLTEEFNALIARHSELDKLLQQFELYDDLSGRDKLTLSEKMRLQIIKQTLSRHGIRDKSDIDRLAAENRELSEKTVALKTELEGCHNLKKAYQEIKDTYNDISKGDYITRRQHLLFLPLRRYAPAVCRSAPLSPTVTPPQRGDHLSGAPLAKRIVTRSRRRIHQPIRRALVPRQRRP